MKISFNPIINFNQVYAIKANKKNQPQIKQSVELTGLDCISNYNMPFCSKAIYAIKYNGDYVKYPNHKIASACLGSSSDSIEKIANGEFHSSNGMTFAYSDQVETKGKVDPQKLGVALLAFRNADNQPIYSIDSSGNFERHSSIMVASEKTGISRTLISQILTGIRGASRNYTFIKAFDVEKRDENYRILNGKNGNPIIDMEAINKAKEGFLYKKHSFPVIRVDKNGEIKIYSCIQDAADDMNHPKKLIQQSITNQSITQGNYTFARLSSVVQLDENNNVVYDEKNNYVIDLAKVEALRKATFKK